MTLRCSKILSRHGKILPRHGMVLPVMARMAKVSLFFGVFTLCACASDPTGKTIPGTTSTALKLTTTPPEASAFVRESRPSNLDYIPVGVTPSGGSAPKRSPAEVTQLENDLKAQQDKSRGFANRSVPKATYDGKPAPKIAPPAKELMERSSEN